jgi:hypothetical protein
MDLLKARPVTAKQRGLAAILVYACKENIRRLFRFAGYSGMTIGSSFGMESSVD